MSHARVTDGTAGVPPSVVHAVPRVRHLAREAIGLMAFSAVVSTTLAACLLVLTTLGHQG